MITKQRALTLPLEPGIYIFEQKGKPIYIGKSISIRTRVLSHIAQAEFSPKERAIVELADAISYKTTLSNFDAILLEAEHIKKYRPKYNVSWKDDKNYLYIKITVKDTYPKIYPVRKENDGKSLYFGPFSSSKMTYTLIYELRRISPFCVQRKISKKPCFYAKLGMCNPCPNYIDSLQDDSEKARLTKVYRNNIRKVRTLLTGRSQQIISDLEKSMFEFSLQERFEDAIIARDKLLKFTMFLERRSFTRTDYSVAIDKPALKEELERFLYEHFKYKLPSSSYRVECFDMSNLQGTHATGSMVVIQDGELSKKDYKKFSIKRGGTSDIYMMKEVLDRRLNHPEWGLPNLIVLDGGKPQLRMIHDLLHEREIDIPLISIAKRPDRILTAGASFRPVSLRKEQLLYKLIQSLRDESHRFAKKYHVLLRDRNRLN